MLPSPADMRRRNERPYRHPSRFCAVGAIQADANQGAKPCSKARTERSCSGGAMATGGGAYCCVPKFGPHGRCVPVPLYGPYCGIPGVCWQ
jgi:hypothetical protein